MRIVWGSAVISVGIVGLACSSVQDVSPGPTVARVGILGLPHNFGGAVGQKYQLALSARDGVGAVVY